MSVHAHALLNRFRMECVLFRKLKRRAAAAMDSGQATTRVEGSRWPEGGRAIAVSVIIPHLDDSENLDRCLTLLGRQSFPAQSIEVIVVDNGSKVGFDSICALVGTRATAVRASHRGAGLARNAGVAVSRGKVLAFLDSDCRPDPGWIEAGVDSLDEYDIAGGAVRVDVADPGNMSPTEAFEVVFAFRNAMYIRSKGFTVTASMFVRREVFDAVGPFRAGVSEDVDWCHRARGMGYRLGYAPQAMVGHPARRTWAELKRKSERLVAESYALYREAPYGRVQWFAWAWLGPVSILPHLVYVFATGKLARFQDRLNAAGILCRFRLARFLQANRIAVSQSAARRGGVRGRSLIP
jgi:glycosyltransferase involved in cell wall biosynthesis